MTEIFATYAILLLFVLASIASSVGFRAIWTDWHSGGPSSSLQVALDFSLMCGCGDGVKLWNR